MSSLIKTDDSKERDEKIKNILSEQDILAKKFWDIIRYLMDKYSNISDSPFGFKVFCMAIKGIMLVNSQFCIQKVGAFMFKFREEIDNKNIKWIYDFKFESQIIDWNILICKYNKALASKVSKITLEVRDYLNSTSASMNEEKSIELCQTFLQWYCKYSLLDKELNELKQPH